MAKAEVFLFLTSLNVNQLSQTLAPSSPKTVHNFLSTIMPNFLYQTKSNNINKMCMDKTFLEDSFTIDNSSPMQATNQIK